jgi:hypothetical protein
MINKINQIIYQLIIVLIHKIWMKLICKNQEIKQHKVVEQLLHNNINLYLIQN